MFAKSVGLATYTPLVSSSLRIQFFSLPCFKIFFVTWKARVIKSQSVRRVTTGHVQLETMAMEHQTSCVNALTSKNGSVSVLQTPTTTLLHYMRRSHTIHVTPVVHVFDGLVVARAHWLMTACVSEDHQLTAHLKPQNSLGNGCSFLFSDAKTAIQSASAAPPPGDSHHAVSTPTGLLPSAATRRGP